MSPNGQNLPHGLEIRESYCEKYEKNATLDSTHDLNFIFQTVNI